MLFVEKQTKKPKSFNVLDVLDVLVYCQGKCGSSTLNYTLKKNGYKTLKLHNIGSWIRRSGKNEEDLYELINRSSINKKLYIIDSYRTPIERKISSFFQNIDKHVPNYKDKSLMELRDIFNKKILKTTNNHRVFDNMMIRYGLEPFKNFDFKKKYIIKEKGNLVFVKIIFSNLKNWNNILSEIFKKEIKFYPSNLSKDKEYYLLYKNFKESYKVPIDYLNNDIINSQDFKIYNTKEEQKNYINKWLKKSSK